MNPILFFKKNTPIRKLLTMYSAAGGGLTAYSETGNPLTFVTDVAKKLKKLLVNFTPVQDLHGQDAPYPGGGGKNKFDVSTYPFTDGKIIRPDSGAYNSTSGYKATADFVPCGNLKGRTVTLNKRPGGNNVGFAFYSSNNVESYISGEANSNQTAGTPWTITIPATAEYMRFTVQYDATDIQIELGSTATDFAPYSNICPISGWTGANVVRTGKNLFDDSSPSNYNAKTIVFGENQYNYDTYLKAGTYTASVNGVTSYVYALCYGDAVADRITIKGKSATSNTFTITKSGLYAIWLYNNTDNISASDLVSMQIEVGSSASEHESYSCTTYPISWQTEAGTVYGGTLDVTTGVLTVDRVKIDLSSLSWADPASGATSYRGTGNPLNVLPTGTSQSIVSTGKCLSNQYKVTNSTVVAQTDGNIAPAGGGRMLYLKDTGITSLEDIAERIADAYVIMPLATPKTYQLTKQTIAALVGDNTVFSDANGNCEVTYLKKG